MSREYLIYHEHDIWMYIYVIGAEANVCSAHVHAVREYRNALKEYQPRGSEKGSVPLDVARDA